MVHFKRLSSLFVLWVIFPLLFALSFSLPHAYSAGILHSTEFRSLIHPPPAQFAIHLNQAEEAFFACEEQSSQCLASLSKFWLAHRTDLLKLNRLDQIAAINRLVNQFPYHTDLENFGQADYWTSPLEFLQHSGDCEDYAIFKFFLLRHLGIPNDQLRIVLLWNSHRMNAHAVLAFVQKDAVLILDNEHDDMLPDHQLPHYVPAYSFNETSAWSHLPNPQKTGTFSP